MNEERSTLPSLKKIRLFPKDNSTCSPKMKEFSSNFFRFYPQIQTIEKNVASLKEQIPSGLQKTILNLQQDTQRVLEKQNPLLSTGKIDPAIQKSLDDLEKRLTDSIHVSVEKSKKELENKLNEKINRSDLFKEMNRFKEDNANVRFTSVDKFMRYQSKTFYNHIAEIENEMSKLSQLQKVKEKDATLQRISQSMDANNAEMNDAFHILNRLEEEYKRKENQMDKIDAFNNQICKVKPRKETPKNEYNSAQEYKKIVKTLSDFRNEFLQKSLEIERQGELSRQFADEIEQMAADILESIEGIKLHTNETEGLVKDLSETVNKLAKQANDDFYPRVIAQLASQIQVSHNSIKASIDVLNDKLRNAELSVPLI